LLQHDHKPTQPGPSTPKPNPPKRSNSLKPGESWRAEYVIRNHQRYWDPPMWDRQTSQPPPPWVPPAGTDEGADEDLIADGEGEGGGQGGHDAAWEASS